MTYDSNIKRSEKHRSVYEESQQWKSKVPVNVNSSLSLIEIVYECICISLILHLPHLDSFKNRSIDIAFLYLMSTIYLYEVILRSINAINFQLIYNATPRTKKVCCLFKSIHSTKFFSSQLKSWHQALDN